MTESRGDQSEINARIVYWGISGAGISANLATIHGKLKESNRGALRKIATRIDPTVEYEVLPIELGKMGGVRTRMHVIGVPGSTAQAPTRKQLLDRIDGIVFVADSRAECLEANVASLNELIETLADYGHGPSDLPFVIQYNKCDLVDPFVIERLHREIKIHGAAVYEASAKTGTGVLKTLTTISKQVIRHLGKRGEVEAPADPAASQPEMQTQTQAPPVVEAPIATQPEPALPTTPSPETAMPPAEVDLTSETRSREASLEPSSPMLEAMPVQPPAPRTDDADRVLSLMESAILAESADDVEAEAVDAVASHAESMLHQPWDAVSHEAKSQPGAHIGADLRIVSVGEARLTGERGLSVPIVLSNDEGETITLALSIQLDPLLDGDS